MKFHGKSIIEEAKGMEYDIKFIGTFDLNFYGVYLKYPLTGSKHSMKKLKISYQKKNIRKNWIITKMLMLDLIK